MQLQQYWYLQVFTGWSTLLTIATKHFSGSFDGNKPIMKVWCGVCERWWETAIQVSLV